MSVSQTRGVIRRSELTDAPARAESLDVYKVVRNGEIAFNKMSIRAGALGVSAEDGLVTYHYEVMRPRSGHEAQYLVYLMKSDWFIGELVRRERGIGAGEQANVRTTEVPFRVLRMIDARLPPLDEQRAIADFLNRETAKIDALIDKQNEMIDLLQERRRHTIQHGVAPSGSQGDRLPLKRALLRVDQGISPDTSTGTDEAVFWVLKSGAPNRGVFDEEESKPVPDSVVVPSGIEVRPGDLIVSRASGSVDLVGSAAMVGSVSRRLILSDKTFRLQPKPSMFGRYLYWSLNSPNYRSQVRLAISGADGLANNLPLSALRRVLLWLPPLAEQCRIAEQLDRDIAKIDALMAKAEQFVELAKERRAALITAAVTGQLDVTGKGGWERASADDSDLLAVG